MSMLSKKIKGIADPATVDDLAVKESEPSVADELAEDELRDRIWKLFYAFCDAVYELDDMGDESGQEPSSDQYNALIDELAALLKQAIAGNDETKSLSIDTVLQKIISTRRAGFTPADDTKGAIVETEKKQAEAEAANADDSTVTDEKLTKATETPVEIEKSNEDVTDAPATDESEKSGLVFLTARVDEMFEMIKSLVPSQTAPVAPNVTADAPAPDVADEELTTRQAELKTVTDAKSAAEAEVARISEELAAKQAAYEALMAKKVPAPDQSRPDVPAEELKKYFGLDVGISSESDMSGTVIGKSSEDLLKGI